MVLLLRQNWVLIATLLVFATPATARECLSSAAAVRAEHGVSTWAGWTVRNAEHKGQKCWFASARREVVHSDVGQRRQRPTRFERNDAVPAPSVARAEVTTADVMRIGFELRWRRALSERLNEWWTSIYGQVSVSPRTVPTFNERYAGFIPKEEI